MVQNILVGPNRNGPIHLTSVGNVGVFGIMGQRWSLERVEIKSSRSLMLDDDITFRELSSVWVIPGLDNKKSEALRQLSAIARLCQKYSKLPKELFYFEFLWKGLL